VLESATRVKAKNIRQSRRRLKPIFQSRGVYRPLYNKVVQKSNVTVEFQPFKFEVIVGSAVGLVLGGVAAIPTLGSAKIVASKLGISNRVAVLLIGTAGLQALRALGKGTMFGKGVEIAVIAYAILWGAAIPSVEEEGDEELRNLRHFVGTGVGIGGWAATRLLIGSPADLLAAAVAAYYGAKSIS